MSIAELETNNAAAILGRMIQADRGDFSPEAAEAILKIQFDPRDEARMHTLAAMGQAGELTEREQAEVEEYRRAGYLIDLLQAKARLSLERAAAVGLRELLLPRRP